MTPTQRHPRMPVYFGIYSASVSAEVLSAGTPLTATLAF